MIQRAIFHHRYCLAISLLIMSMGIVCKAQNTQPMPTPLQPNDSYEQAWAKVDSLDRKGLPQSALEVVDQIYQKAKKEKAHGQLVKAVIHQLKFMATVEEEALVKTINRLENEALEAEFPVQPLLYSMLGDIYWQYFQYNRYRFYDRTTTQALDDQDIRTWDLQKIVVATHQAHQKALANPQKLQSVQIDIYEEVIKEGDEAYRVLRPTLYDFIAHRAVDFWMNSEPEITRPAYQFSLNDEKYLSSASDFVQMEIESLDTLSFDFQAIQTLQGLLAFHLGDENVATWIDVDLKRLRFVHQNLNSSVKDQLYLEVLASVAEQGKANPIWAEVSYQMAKLHQGLGQQYNPRQADRYQNEYKKALEICQQAIQKYPESTGAQNCRSLQAEILTKSLRVEIEQVNVPEMPFRALISYRNLEKLYWKIVPVQAGDEEKILELGEKNYDPNKSTIEFYRSRTAVQSWTTDLPQTDDYQTHYVEEKLPALPLGEYIIFASDNPDFQYDKNAVAYAFTTISNLSYIHRSNRQGGDTEFYVLNRQTGHPEANVQAEAWHARYDYQRRKYRKVKLGAYTSDAEGYLSVPALKERNFYMIFKKGQDQLQSSDRNNFYAYQYNNQKERVRTQAHLFLDRAIYRPGQTVYFKGILIESTNGKDPQILPNQKTTVVLRDVNYQVSAEMELTTNEYGTFSGKFTAPDNGLNGQMRIESYRPRKSESPKGQEQYGESFGTVTFSVEDYKRPKFEVKFDPVQGSFRLGEEITVQGKARSFSGANVDGAQVSYRVVRKARFPYWWFYSRGFYPTSPEMEIANGVLETDETGNFEITFKAIPDPNISEASSPTFIYQVYADVTDLNGETQSNQTSVPVSYQALEVGVSIGNEVNREKTGEWKIKTTNLVGEFEAAQGKITIHRLQAPEKAYRERLWDAPDQFLYTEAEWHELFPHDLYQNENQITNWAKGEKVLDIDFNTAKQKAFTPAKLSQWKTGKYILEIQSQDRFGKEVKGVQYFTLYAPQVKQIPFAQIDYVNELKIKGEPGEKAQILVGTSAKDLQVLYEIEHQGEIVRKQWLQLNAEQKLLEIPIEEKHRGNLGFHYTFVRNGRYYGHSQTISVPRTNKELDISFETYRDKLQPGEKEEWRLRIRGKNGEKVAAEMLATLYDASLDQFRANNWNFNIYNSYYTYASWQSNSGFLAQNFQIYQYDWNPYFGTSSPDYDALDWFGFNLENTLYPRSVLAGRASGIAFDSAEQERAELNLASDVEEEAILGEVVVENASPKRKKAVLGNSTSAEADDEAPPAPPADAGGEPEQDLSGIQARSNFKETAFFYPHLKTDENGDILIQFIIPEALTRWKMLGLTHSKDLKYGLATNELITQKELMVVPNPPRFFRESDQLAFSSKITNVSEKDLEGTAQLFLLDALTNQPIDQQLGNDKAEKKISIPAGQSVALAWDIQIPAGYQAITYKVVAKAGKFTDGEEMTLPVLTNRMLVTETMPLPIRGNQTKTFTMEKLVSSASSPTLRQHQVTLEFTSNPAWYAVQALPYLMEFPHECAEQTFSRFYANALASHIANSNPKIQEVFQAWRDISPDALLSSLEKNEELKGLILEATPWLLQAKDESERKRQLGVLFDLRRMSNELDKALRKLQQKQVSSGAWAWFDGMREDRYLTQHIVTGVAHLRQLGVEQAQDQSEAWQMTRKAIGYLDRELVDDYRRLRELARQKKIKLEDRHIGYLQIHYLYARSYYGDIQMSKELEAALGYYQEQAQKYWLEFNRYLQGMIALSLHRYEDQSTPADIVKSLKEKALNSEELGMYWKSDYGYYWYQAPIETQALMIEVFDEVAQDAQAVDGLKTWLLKQKQTQDWKTTKATAEACYALLLRGANWLIEKKQVEISIGGQNINPYDEASALPVEAGTGYFKTSWSAEEVKPEMGNITVSKKDEGVAWGALYWQYFEQLDKITTAETPLQLKKQLFLQKNSDSGPVITPITDETELKVGDLIKVRIELRVDRQMEYVHMQDMRASGLEPLNVISRYQYQDGLGYYESTRDAATHFFFGYLPKGTFVFEYPLRVTHEGDFSNGITTIQSMYAPEFSSHSEGVRVKVE